MADIDIAPSIDIASAEPMTVDFVEFAGVEAGYELAPIEPITADPAPLDIAPIEPDIVDGDWRVIDDTPPTWSPEPYTPAPVSEPAELPPTWSPAPAAPTASPAADFDPRTGAAPSVALVPPAPQPTEVALFSPALSAALAPLANFFMLPALISFLSMTWLFPPAHYGRSSGPRQRASVDYLMYQVESEHGGTVHYYLNNIKKIKLTTETYTDEGLYIFTVPIYLKGRMERAIEDLAETGIYIEES